MVHAQTSYLSQISQIISMEKNLACGEHSDFCKEFEQSMDFYRNLCCFCSNIVWRKICVEKNDKYEVCGINTFENGASLRSIDKKISKGSHQSNLQPLSHITSYSASKSQPNISLTIPTKLQPQSLEQNSASKYEPKFSTKILIKIQLQNIDLTSVVIGAFQNSAGKIIN